MVKGQTRAGGVDDVDDYCFEVAEDIAGVHPQRLDVVQAQPSVARFIKLRLVAAVVRLTVDFYAEFCGGAEEVEGVASCGVLFTELQVFGSLA
jgi:hypothetical protein